jgi:conjugal transfer pilus assembly protein TraI
MSSLIARCQAAWSAFRAPPDSVSNRDDGCAPASVGPEPEIPRYPPFLKGLPVARTAQILETQRELIAGLQDALAFTDADYQALVYPLVERYAAFVHLLPASETHHHRGAGGLFRHGLEVAFQAARASRGRLFALDRRPEERRLLEPRWHLAACIVGLLHDIGKPVADVLVVDRTGTQRWQPVDETLSDWADAHGINRYFLRWNAQRVHHGHEIFTTSVLHQVLTRPVRTWLMDPDPLVWHTLSRVLAGSDTQALLYQLMREADQASVAQDLRENRLDPEALSLGVPIERYLVDTMRALLREGTWAVNTPGARVWIFPPNSVHLVWPACAEAIVQRLTDERIPGIPHDPDTLADILIERHLARPRPVAEGEPAARYWRLAPAILAREQPVELSFLRLATPELLFSGVVPSPTPLVPTPGTVADQSTRGHEAPSEVRPVVVPEAAPPPSTQQTAPPESPAETRPVVALEAAPTPPADQTAPPLVSESTTGHKSAVDTDAVDREPSGTADPDAQSAGAPQEAARAWLARHVPAGTSLMAIAEALTEGRLTLDAQPTLIDGKLFLPYPQALTGLAVSPEAVLKDLVARHWIECDPLRPLLKLREQGGVTGLWLNREVSRPLLALGLGTPAMSDGCPPAAEAVAVTPSAAVTPTEPTAPDRAPVTHATTGRDAADYARHVRQRLLARDPALGPIVERPGALAIALRGPLLEEARRAGISEIALRRALEKLPGARPVEQGIFTLGL